MGYISLRNNEIEKLKASLWKEEDNKIKEDNAYLAEVQNNFKLTRQLENNMDESISAQDLAEAKENI